MERIKCIISYDGSDFSGYQVQPHKRTVQGVFEAVLKKMHKGEHIKLHGSGRTDAGVHARGQVVHFDTPLSIPLLNWKKALNTMLPDDVVVLSVEVVPSDFHSRFSVKEKEYRYFVLESEHADVFRRRYVYQLRGPLDLESMKVACRYFIGTHDFTSFCAANTSVVDKVRTISHFDVEKTEKDYCFQIVGNGFLYQMVRIIVGTVLEIGKGHASPEIIPDILSKQDRAAAFKTAPANGLYLWKVTY